MPALPPAGPVISPENWGDLAPLAEAGLSIGGASGTLDDVAWAPSGGFFAVSWRIVNLIDAVALEKFFPASPDDEQVNGAVAFSPDGQLLAATGDNPVAVLLDANTRQRVRELTSISGSWIVSLVFSPDGSRLAGGTIDGHLVVWEVQSGDLVWSVGETGGAVTGVAWRDDGLTIASGSEEGYWRLWDAADGEVLQKVEIEGPVRDVVFIPASTQLLTAARHIQLWNADSGELLDTFRLKQAASALAVSPDGSLFAMGRCAEWTEENPFECAVPGEVLIWAASTREFLGTLHGHTGRTILAAFSPDGTRLLTVSDSGPDFLRMWSVRP